MCQLNNIKYLFKKTCNVFVHIYIKIIAFKLKKVTKKNKM